MSKNIRILTAILVLVAVGILVLKRRNKQVKSKLIGQSLISLKKLFQVDEFIIEKNNKESVSIHVKKDANNHWSLISSDNFPADAKIISKFFDTLQKSQYIREISVEKNQNLEFGLDKNRLMLELKANKQSILQLYLGKERSGGGAYVSFKNQPEIVYLVTDALNVETNPDSWELKTLLDLKKETIKSYTFANQLADKKVILSKNKKEDAFKLVGLSEKEQVKPSELSDLNRLASNLIYTKRYDHSNEEAKAAFSSPEEVVIEQFDGEKWTIQIGKIGEKEKEKYFIRVQAQKNPLTQFMDKAGVYELSSYKAENFIKRRADFVEPKKESKAENLSSPSPH